MGKYDDRRIVGDIGSGNAFWVTDKESSDGDESSISGSIIALIIAICVGVSIFGDSDTPAKKPVAHKAEVHQSVTVSDSKPTHHVQKKVVKHTVPDNYNIHAIGRDIPLGKDISFYRDELERLKVKEQLASNNPQAINIKRVREEILVVEYEIRRLSR